MRLKTVLVCAVAGCARVSAPGAADSAPDSGADVVADSAWDVADARDASAEDAKCLSSGWRRFDTGLPSAFMTSVSAPERDLAFATHVVGAPSPSSGVLKWSGEHWVSMPLPSPSTAGFPKAIWAVSADDAYFAGDLKLHWNGTTWQSWGDNEVISGIWASSPTNVWAAGLRPSSPLTGELPSVVVMHYDGSIWTTSISWEQHSSIPAVDHNYNFAIFGAADGVLAFKHVMTVANHFDFARPFWWDGTAWTELPHPNGDESDTTLRAWVGGRNDIWIAYNGQLDHFDGGSWRMSASPPGHNYRAIWGSSGTDLWAVGDGGLISHGDGATWTVVSACTTENLTAVSGSSASDVWIVGDHGVTLHRTL